MRGTGLIAALFAIYATSAAQAIEFSADAVAHNSTGQTRTSKIYISNGMVRVDQAGALFYEVLDTKKQSGHFIVPTKKLNVEQPAVMAAQNAAAYNVGATPCIKIVAIGGLVNCTKLGMDKVGGRPTEKWKLIMVSQGMAYISTLWVDRTLGLIVKSTSDRGTFEIQNVHFGPQAASLFVVPSGYTTKQMPAPTMPPPMKLTAPLKQTAPPAKR
jgi:hypothetical protein